MSRLMEKSNPSAASEDAAEPPMSFQPPSLGTRAASSFPDIGIDLRYFPGTVLPERTTLTLSWGIIAPRLIMSIVR